MYPSRFQLHELTAHVLGLLERRREAFKTWDADAEQKLIATAREALAEAGKQFAELADDKPYWAKIEKAVLEVAVPRYFKIAREQLALEAQKYGVWRGGDLVSRIVIGAAGAVVGLVMARTMLPKAFELLPLFAVVFGPLVPDVQFWAARRRWSKQLQRLCAEMGDEQLQQERYRPLEEIAGSTGEAQPPHKERDRA
ncbi:MAG: hypothetical protein QM723_30565 [Myxococcaceae bacterium]